MSAHGEACYLWLPSIRRIREKEIATERKPDGVLGIRDVALRLQIKTAALRAMLRKIACKTPGQRYRWKASDRSLRNLPALIKGEVAKRSKAATTSYRAQA